MGAKDVHINWVDDELTLLKYENAPEEVIANYPEWKVKLHDYYAEDGAAVLSIRSTNPDLLKNIDPSLVAKANRAAKAMVNFRDRKSTRLNSSHVAISYAVFCLKKKIQQ